MADEIWSIDVAINVVGGPQVTNTTRALSQLTLAEQQNSRATQAMNTEHQRATTSLGNMTKQALLMGAGMAGANSAIYAVGNAFRSTLGQAVAFDAGLRNVQSITHITDDELQTLENDLTDLVISGNSAGQSLSQLTDTQYLLASSGFDAQESLQLLNIAAMGAAAGQTDAATSGRVLAAILNAYDLPVSAAKDAMDSLFQTVNLGVIDFEQLSQFMGQVIPTAAALGLSLDDLGAAIAVMTQRGIEPANALTALNQALVQYIDPSAEARKLTAELGIELSADEIRTKGFLGALQDLIPAIQGNDEAISVLFGNVRAMRAIMALTTDGGVAYTQMMEGMQEGHVGAGATAEAFARQEQSVEHQLRELQVVGTAILAEAILPLLRDGLIPLVQAMGALYEVANPVVEAITENEIAMRAFAAIAIGLVGSKALVLIGGWLVSLARAMVGYTVATEAGTAATLSFAAASRTILPIAIAFGALTLWQELKEDPADELAAMAAETYNLADAERERNAVQSEGNVEAALSRQREMQDNLNSAQAEYNRLYEEGVRRQQEAMEDPIGGFNRQKAEGDDLQERFNKARDAVTQAEAALAEATAAVDEYGTAAERAATTQDQLLTGLRRVRDEALGFATAMTPEGGLLRVEEAILEQQIREQEALGAGANVDLLMALQGRLEGVQGRLEGIEGAQGVTKSIADLYKIPGITPEQIQGAITSAGGVISPRQVGALQTAVTAETTVQNVNINVEMTGPVTFEEFVAELMRNRDKVAEVVVGAMNDAIERTNQVLPWSFGR